jgi:hypothetical protein
LRSATGSSFSTDLIAWRDSPFTQIAITTVTVTTTWQRFTLSFTSLDSTAHSVVIGGGGSLVVGENLYVWGAQVEQRSAATAYTVTTTQAIINYVPVLLTAGGGQPRFDHNPTTSESLGLLFELQKTNLITNSGNLSAGTWSTSNTTVTGNTIVAPDGTLTGSKIILNAGATGYMGQSIVVSAGSTVYTVYFKAGEYRRVSLWEGAVSAVNVTFDLISGTIVGQNSATALMTSVGNGWYRCSMISTQTAGSRFWLISPVGDTSTTPFTPATTGNGFNGVYAWGGQLEQAAFPSSYIATTSAAATRASDVAIMSGSNFSSWYNLSEGTFYTEVSFGVASYNVSNAYHLECSDGTDKNRLLAYTGGSVAGLFVTPYGSTGAVSIATAAAPSVNVSYRCGFFLETNNFAVTASAVAPQTDNSGLMPAVNRMNIGSNFSSTEQLNGWIKKLAYYPQAVTSAQLQALTS